MQNVRRDAEGKWRSGTKNVRSKEHGTSPGGPCSLVVLRKCSKVGAFPALWWLSGTEAAGKCLKAHEKCRM